VLTAPLVDPPTTNRDLARFIDHTLLRPEAGRHGHRAALP